MTNALAIRQTAMVENPAGFGNKHAIAAVRDRIMSMMPGAADAPADVVWAAAQLAVAYKLDPFNGEIYIMKLGSKKVGDQWVDDYRAHVGVKGLRKKAREQAQFMTEFRDLSEAEVKDARRAEYDPGDIGVECTLYRLDIARECKSLGIPYKPFRATGFWRVKAKFNKRDSKWEPDNIPNTWTAHDVAEKRAEISVIKRGYDLTINVADPSLINENEAVEVIGHRIGQLDEDRAPFMEHTQQREEDGDILFYGEADFELPAQTVTVGPADILKTGEVHDAVKSFVEKLRREEKPGARVASAGQYKFAVGVIDGITGKDSHGLVFRAIFDRDVNGQAPMAEAAAQLIFKYLCKQKSVKQGEEWVKVENGDYDPTMVEFVGEVQKWAVGHLTKEPKGEPVTA